MTAGSEVNAVQFLTSSSTRLLSLGLDFSGTESRARIFENCLVSVSDLTGISASRLGSISAVFSSPVLDPPKKRSMVSFPEQRLVIEPTSRRVALMYFFVYNFV